MTAKGCVLATLVGAISGLAVGDVHTVGVGNTYYDPQFLFAQPGDTIRWQWEGGTHDVTSGESCGMPDGQVYSGTINSANQVFEWTVPGGQDDLEYYCSEGAHCVNGNQFGIIFTEGNGVLHTVSTNGYDFEPAAFNVNPGDTIVWVHGGGSHDVTFGSGCLPDGTFAEPLTNLNPLAVYHVPESAAGTTQHYFCTPHCGWGMEASFVVNDVEPDCPTDVDGNGTTNVDDLLAMLGEFGSDCAGGCDADVDDDGDVDVDDLLALLGEFGNDC